MIKPPYIPRLTLFREWLKTHRNLNFENYDELWKWSVTDIEDFWQAMWDYTGIESPTPYLQVLKERCMPGAKWFEGAQVNYARQVLRHVEPATQANLQALIGQNERGDVQELSWLE